MSKLFDLIKTGVLDVSVSPGNSFVKYTEQDLKWGGTNSWFQVDHILEDLPDSVNEEELVKEIISLLMDANYESDELIEKNNNEYENKKDSVVKKESPRGYVYLMMNNRNGYIKIGFTKDYPTYRESTLQSQEPEIELIDHWKGSMDDEQQLHRMFDEKRLRGEWFSLDPEDISKVDEYFSS